jgi:hypothetical protein
VLFHEGEAGRQQADRKSVGRITDSRIVIRHINGSRPSRNS